jgi:transposase-like protein
MNPPAGELWLSWTRNSLQAEKFLKTLVRLYGGHPVWTDGAPWYSDACRSLGLEHYRYKAPYSDGEGYTVIEG